jgi:hypothetical protein
MGIFYGNKLFRIFIFFTESGKIKLQQNKDVIIGDEEDSDDVTTKDQDDFSDKTSRMLRSHPHPPPARSHSATHCRVLS